MERTRIQQQFKKTNEAQQKQLQHALEVDHISSTGWFERIYKITNVDIMSFNN